MIDYKEMVLTIGTNSGQVISFDTWWMTPFGICGSLDEAKRALDSRELPYDILRPITVAVCSNGLYEPII